METFETDVRAYHKKGYGLAKHPTKTKESFILKGVIGDVVRVQVSGKKKGRTVCSILELLKASGDRVAPKCEHAKECGGCSWQQVSYSAQLLEKQKQVEALFLFDVAPIIPADPIWRYRNKMEFSFSQDKAGNKYLGLIKPASRGRVLPLNSCHLTPEWFTIVLKGVRDWWDASSLKAYHTYSDAGALQTLTIREGRNTGEKLIMLTVSGNADYALSKADTQSFVQVIKALLPDENPSIFLQLRQIHPGKKTQFFEVLLSGSEYIHEVLQINDKRYTFTISPSSFFQPNTSQAERLYAKALEMTPVSKNAILFDLYCGTATLGIAFSPFVKEVVGIELNPYAVYDAEVNVETNHVNNVRLLKGDVPTILAAETLPRPDIVLIDPPRAGITPKGVDQLVKLNPEHITYISCNPHTQAEDVQALCSRGYRIQAIQPVDQFPHTPHIENIVCLTRGCS